MGSSHVEFYAKFDLNKGLSKHWQKKVSHLVVTLDILQRYYQG